MRKSYSKLIGEATSPPKTMRKPSTKAVKKGVAKSQID